MARLHLHTSTPQISTPHHHCLKHHKLHVICLYTAIVSRYHRLRYLPPRRARLLRGMPSRHSTTMLHCLHHAVVPSSFLKLWGSYLCVSMLDHACFFCAWFDYYSFKEKGSFVVFVIYLVSNISSVKKIEWSLLVAFKLNWYFVWLSYCEALIEILLLYVVNGWVYRSMPDNCLINCLKEKEFGALLH